MIMIRFSAVVVELNLKLVCAIGAVDSGGMDDLFVKGLEVGRVHDVSVPIFMRYLDCDDITAGAIISRMEQEHYLCPGNVYIPRKFIKDV